MAAVLGSMLMSKVESRNDHEKAFLPWWDVMEDYMVYGLVLVGLILIPQAVVSGTPLFCEYCVETNCDYDHTGKYVFLNQTRENNPNFGAWWSRNYCTYNAQNEEVRGSTIYCTESCKMLILQGEPLVELFVLFYPYYILMFALTLYMLENGFKELFSSKDKQNCLYKLLVKYKIFASDDSSKSDSDCDLPMEVDDAELFQLKFFVKNKKFYRNYYLCYFLRTLFGFAIAIPFFVSNLVYGLPALISVGFEGS